jgi:hypothetical protein
MTLQVGCACVRACVCSLEEDSLKVTQRTREGGVGCVISATARRRNLRIDRNNQVLVNVNIILKHGEGIAQQQPPQQLVPSFVQAAVRDVEAGVVGHPKARYVGGVVVLPS